MFCVVVVVVVVVAEATPLLSPLPRCYDDGTGKSTLLDILAGRKNTGVVKGSILVNGLVCG